jgi:hypothetical protein
MAAGVAGIKHTYYTNRAQETRDRRWPIPAPRGNIYDRNDTPLALNLKLFGVAADPHGNSIPDQSAGREFPSARSRRPGLTSWCEGVAYVRLRDDVDERAARSAGVPGSSHPARKGHPHGTVAAGLLGSWGRRRMARA